ncbi:MULTISPECIES: hypothetical protein [Bacteroides]|jgi:hypothetical protein bacD2_23304|uniref:hypothetical protein n=1 Tax=Bacteroides TaxID=816 RepID=UPI000E996441|nr:hypothetical protein [Bacteroides ovatus]RGE77925.1 hypothetical protein DXA11_19775 [Bacteroides sp. AM56-10ce]DAS48081.1 MAG TPA: ASCH domain protein [Caudoviricetes sp.]DAU04128.1 MAG TPA: ASCH domain protein [Caudoviricetes sp.]
MKKIMFNDKLGLTQAVLEGRKTMTRRICKYDRPDESWDIVFPVFGSKDYDNEGNLVSPLFGAFGWKNKDGDFTGWNNPLYKVGEVVAIAQSYRDLGYSPDSLDRHPKDLSIRGLMKNSAGWNNKMFVKSYACKHHIKITNVKVERLQDISDEDCLKEGIIHAYTDNNGIKRYHTPHTKRGYLSTDVAQQAFSFLIDKVSGKGTWESNPFVFAYEFVLVD